MSEARFEQDELLLARLRDLALVDIDSLTAGLPSDRANWLVAGYAHDAHLALLAAYERVGQLRTNISSLDVGVALLGAGKARKSGDGRAFAERVAKSLRERGELARLTARFDDCAAGLWPRFLEAERRCQ